MLGKNGPIRLVDAIACFTTIERPKVERTMDIDVAVGQIDPLSKHDEVVTSGV